MELSLWSLLACGIQLAGGGFSPFVVPLVFFLGAAPLPLHSGGVHSGTTWNWSHVTPVTPVHSCGSSRAVSQDKVTRVAPVHPAASSGSTTAGWRGVVASADSESDGWIPEKELNKRRGRCCRQWVKGILRQDASSCKIPLLIYSGRAQGTGAGLCALIFGLIGGLMLTDASVIFEEKIEYRTGDVHKVINIGVDLPGPVLLSYEIGGFYANRRGFIESKDDNLVGGLFTSFRCDGAQDPADVRWRRCSFVQNGSSSSLCTSVERARNFRPCGLVALSMFTDRYELINLDRGTTVRLIERDLALPYDHLFGEGRLQRSNDTSGAYLMVAGERSWLEDGAFLEHFKAWYRNPPSPCVRHVWARIEEPLPKGSYMIRFLENDPVWDVWMEDSHKRVVLSQVHPLGNRGAIMFLCVVCLVLSAFQVVMTFLFFAFPLFKS